MQELNRQDLNSGQAAGAQPYPGSFLDPEARDLQTATKLQTARTAAPTAQAAAGTQIGAVTQSVTQSITQFGAIASPLPWLETIAPLAPQAPDSFLARLAQGTAPVASEWLEAELDRAGLLHDMRNMVTAIDLYCDLLEEPGVLSAAFHHYARELRLVGLASRRLLDRLAVIRQPAANATATANATSTAATAGTQASSIQPSVRSATPKGAPAPTDSSVTSGVNGAAAAPSLTRTRRMQALDAGEPISSLAQELQANQNLISAVAGPGVTVELALNGGHRPVPMTAEDLTRVLINLTRNAAEAMPNGGKLRIALEETPEVLSLTVTDTGSGIPDEALERIFSTGVTTRSIAQNQLSETDSSESGRAEEWPVQHRGLGLTIVRSLVAGAGGRVWAANCSGSATEKGAIFTIEFPRAQGTVSAVASAKTAAGSA